MATTQHHVKSDLLREVRRADPEWETESRKPIAYRLSHGRVFREVTDESGPYDGSEWPWPH